MFTIFIQAFLAALLAELKLDRTIYVGASLSARYPLNPVVTGIVIALTTKMALAAALGSILMPLLPRPTWEILSRTLTVGLLLVTAALLLYRVKDDKQRPDPAHNPDVADRSSFARVATAAFAIVFFTEWFDRSQLLVMSIAADGARTIGFAAVLAAGCGGALALIAREALALLIGARLRHMVAPRVLRGIAALLCIALALWTLIQHEEEEYRETSRHPQVTRGTVHHRRLTDGKPASNAQWTRAPRCTPSCQEMFVRA